MTVGAFGEMVTYQHAVVSGRSARGNDVVTFTETTVGPCAFVPGTEAEAAVGTEQVTAAGELYMPPGTPVSPLDRIVRGNGETYEITGEASRWASPYTSLAGPTLVRVRRVTGATGHMTTEAG